MIRLFVKMVFNCKIFQIYEDKSRPIQCVANGMKNYKYCLGRPTDAGSRRVVFYGFEICGPPVLEISSLYTKCIGIRNRRKLQVGRHTSTFNTFDDRWMSPSRYRKFVIDTFCETPFNPFVVVKYISYFCVFVCFVLFNVTKYISLYKSHFYIKNLLLLKSIDILQGSHSSWKSLKFRSISRSCKIIEICRGLSVGTWYCHFFLILLSNNRISCDAV